MPWLRSTNPPIDGRKKTVVVGKVSARKASTDREDDKEPSVPRPDGPETVNQERRIKARESKNSKIVSRDNKGKRNTPDKDDLPNPDPATTADYDKSLHNLRAFHFSYPMYSLH
jgi:hypothetical protein